MSKIFTAIGLMSGTSMDGVDAAIVCTDGESQLERTSHALLRRYDEGERSSIRAAIDVARHVHDRIVVASAGGAQGGFRSLCSSEQQRVLDAAERAITQAHAEAVRLLLKGAGLIQSDIDLVGFHGQTIYHNPAAKMTVQLGDGQWLADEFGLAVVHDFRTADVASGGQGAPLVPVYHRALALAAKLDLPVAVVNVGGVANVTYVGDAGELIAFDTGPGNALIDDWMAAKTGTPMDCGGACAAGGSFSERVLGRLLSDPYFSQEPPKSLDRDHFRALALPLVGSLSTEMGARTLTVFTVMSVAKSDFFFPMPPRSWIICGGGARNATMMEEFRKRLDGRVLTAEDLGWSADFMEAEAFAYLAVRSLRRLPLSFPSTTGVAAPLTGGTLCHPRLT